MANETEPRALGAALAAPAFVTRAHGAALHAANRHVERWAPEAGANRVRSMRSLGFVDRLVAPWMETAQRSASLRLFHQYAHTGLGERSGSSVSWVFPRPWYQDELDWMAAARQVGGQTERTRQVPSLLTTRGTYVAPSGAPPSALAPAAAPGVALPAALYEYVAPSLSLAASRPAAITGVGFGGESLPRSEAYSPLISLAAVQAAELMTRTVAPLVAPRAAAGAATMTPGLRSVLTSILARAASARGEQPTRLSAQAPALETPPAPRPEATAGDASTPALEVAEHMAAQRVRVAELQRVAHQAAQRELAARDVAPATRAPSAAEPARASDAAAVRAPAQPAAELRAAAERAEAELRQRTAAPSTTAAEAARADAATAEGERARAATAPSAETQRQADAAERARIEERVAQRVTERASIQRLHDQARAEAAAHARAAVVEPARAAAVAPAAPAAPRAPAEVTAAIAGLPPELAALLGSVVAQRPERAAQAIGELTETLRTVELLARGSASGAAFEATRGPRLVMPAGLGGLVSAVDRAQSIAELPGQETGQLGSLTRGRSALLGGERPLAPLPQLVGISPISPVGAAAPARDLRVPNLPWLSAAPRPQAIAASSALGATASTAPAALSHVAWSDRWLARFAGATPRSLDMISAAGAAAPAARTRALAAAAPGVVFVAPDFVRGDLAADPIGRAFAASLAPAAPAALTASVAPTAAPAVGPTLLPSPPANVLRFDDEGETPDDVFAAIAAAASRGRTAPARPSAFASAAPRAAAEAPAPAAHPAMLADVVAHAAPRAPGAGLSAQLASSPFAAALRHVLSLPSAPSFDVRSLFGADLGAVYLAGLIGPASRELEIGAQSAPAWAMWREAPAAALADRPDRIDRLVPTFDVAYVSPELAPSAAAEAAAAGELAAAPVAAPGAAPGVAAPGAAPGVAAALTTVRTALLSWDLTTTSLPGVQPGGQPSAPPWMPAELALVAPSLTAAPQSLATPRDAAASVSTAQRMIDAMALPLLGEATREQPAAWAAPGMLAERAQTWSIAQERSASDLALDFVPPELVLAARVYGLGPAEAAQAARLAIAGPGQLGAMASTIDRTFVEAMAIGRDARLDAERHRRIAAAAEAPRAGAPAAIAPVAPGEPFAPAATAAATPETRAAITTAFPTADGAIAAAISPLGAPGAGIAAALPSSGAAFGVDRRAPRGAFLWPSATVAALGMHAAAPDGQLSMSVAALELLAAQVVAELGTFTVLSGALSDARAAALGLDGDAVAPGAAPRSVAGPLPMGAADLATGSVAPTMSATGATGATGATAAAPSEPREADVLGAAAAMVPASRRARFDALYVALGQSPTGLHWSPAARAARALALAGRGEEGPVSARQRAAAAWDVLPVVYGGDSAAAIPATADAADPASASISASAAIAQAMTSHVAPSWLSGSRAIPGAALARGTAARGRGPGGRDFVAGAPGGGIDAGPVQVGGPGLSALSARAGEALGSYIAPAPPPIAPRERQVDSSSVGAVLRAPTAEPEYVHTGARSSGRYGGGEVEIPPWFEAAARKMLAERSGDGAGISLAELTLVTAAPAAHVAASTRSAPSASPPSPGSAAAAQQQHSAAPQIDIEKLANEVYRNILVLMDVARARNGNPYL